MSNNKMKITDYFQLKTVNKFAEKNNETKQMMVNDHLDHHHHPQHHFQLSEIMTDENLYELTNNNDENYYCYFHYPYQKDTIPLPLTQDDDYSIPFNHVTLPFQENVSIFHDGIKYNKWSLIQKILSSKIVHVFQLEKAIKTYNPLLEDIYFDILKTYIQYQLNDTERNSFFDKLLPNIIRLALDLPRLFCYNLANLDQGTSTAVFLSQQQISSLLANAFLCTYSQGSSNNRRCINFVNLFSTNGCKETNKCRKLEKLKCLLEYLKRVTEIIPIGTVSFERKILNSFPSLKQSEKSITNFEFNHDRCLVEDGCNYSQVDFAHKFIGGGVLDIGCVQEEILFVVCPELIVAKLICEKLLDNEAIIITGVEQFNQFTGYADKFRWKSSYYDKQLRDKYGRRFRQILAMDAIYFHLSNKNSQYEKKKIDRELNKAIAAFQCERFLIKKHPLPTVATGNWGCGVYNGDPYIKAMIQIIAASQMDRNLMYFTYNNLNLKSDFDQIKLLIQTNQYQTITVGKLYRTLLQYAKDKSQTNSHLDLVSYLSKNLNRF